jgi:hypothetical protein
MRTGVVFLLAATVFMMGCGSQAPKATPTLRPGTFTSQKFAFSISYDPSQFAAHTTTTARSKIDIPGIGSVTASKFSLKLEEKHVRPSVQAILEVRVLSAGDAVHRPPLNGYTEGIGKAMTAAGQPLDGRPQKVRLGGVAAYRLSYHMQDGWRGVAYSVWRGDFVYGVQYAAPGGAWSSMQPKLDAIARTFAVPQ